MHSIPQRPIPNAFPMNMARLCGLLPPARSRRPGRVAARSRHTYAVPAVKVLGHMSSARFEPKHEARHPQGPVEADIIALSKENGGCQETKVLKKLDFTDFKVKRLRICHRLKNRANVLQTLCLLPLGRSVSGVG